MAKKTTKSPVGGEKSSNRRFIRYGAVLGLWAAVVLAWMSLLSYSPTDFGSAWQYPPAATENAAGQVGAALSHALRYWLGAGSYVGLAFATIAAAILVFGGHIKEWPWRMIGVSLLILAVSTGIYVSQRDAGGVTSITNGSAGVLGHGVGAALLAAVDVTGAWWVICVAAAIGLMFTADTSVLWMLKLSAKGGRRLAALARRRVASRIEKAKAPKPEVKAASVAKPERVRPQPVAKTPAPKPTAQQTLMAKAAAGKAMRHVPAKEAPRADKAASSAKRPASLPSISLLVDAERGYMDSQETAAGLKRQILQQTLNDFNVQAEVVGYQTGPVITMFELSLAPGVKVAQVGSLATDMARALAVSGVRVVPHLAGRDTIGIEVPNDDKEIVRIKDLMQLSPDSAERMYLPLYLGKDAGGDPITADLAAMPHMLIAGTTGSGKSVCINSIIMSLLLTRRPEEVRLILADPKMVEMAAFDGIPHLLCPIINDMRKAETILEWAAIQMDQRYDLLKKTGVKNIAGYNRLDPKELYERLGITDEEAQARIPKRLQYYVIIIDELADLIMTSSKEVETHIIRIAQKARAVGIHMILATQRPSVNVVTGLIKSNMPCRISFQVASRQESRIILDQNGAEVLLGKGDMLVLLPGTSYVARAQGAYVDESEIQRVVRELKKASGEPEFNQELVQINDRSADAEISGERDDMFIKAVEVVLAAQRGSVSLLQRRLQVGYGRASRIIDQMAEAGILGEYKGSQARECLMTMEDWETLQASIEADTSGASASDGQPTSV